MLTTTIQPRFNDTDALGHISNTSFPVWFEEARTALFEIFHPSLDIETWPLILAKTEIDFLAQTYWGSEVKITTYIGKLGSSSCHIIQEARQKEKLVARGLAILIYFDYETNKSVSIPQDIREKLSQHLVKK
ncbi:acyl-CoA thioesterase [Alkalimarinus coralli]|uniref:acyl-CoA thioesterase n=1 Tax=Alkalimarinus coralli TaxID=2935863 RepID=UPI00202B0BEE|nr:thioesterase family protein [Alkalimarinus coralli]